MGHYLLAYPTHHPLPSPERLVQLLQQTLSEIDTLLARFLPPFSVSVNSYKSSLILFAGGQRLRECVVDEETAEDLEKELKLMKRYILPVTHFTTHRIYIYLSIIEK